jgi:two-component system, cell cycle sensor histidine kinase and response regulator CckA
MRRYVTSAGGGKMFITKPTPVGPPYEVATPLRILHLEDSLPDAELVLITLQEAGLPCTSLRVDTKPTYMKALDEGGFDLIISDLAMPAFDGMSALELARQKRPETPFIFVSGTLGEDAAIHSLLNGATDYVLKHQFSRLIPAVQRALTEASERQLRRDMQNQLSVASDRLRNLFENLDDIFISINILDPGLSQISPACERIFGWRAADFIQNPDLFMECIHAEDRRTVVNALADLMAGKVVRNECRIVTRAKTFRWLEFQLKPVLDGNTVTRVDGALRDFTDQKTLERQLMRSQRLESIGTLASGIAHDLNNVLTPIMIGVQLLRDRTTDSRSIEMLGTLELSTARGAELIRQVLAFARGIEEQRKSICLPRVFAEIKKILAETLPRSISTYTEIPETLWPVRGDFTQLHQLVLNLCVNARDAMPSGGELTMIAGNVVIQEPREADDLKLIPGPYVRFEICDTGRGIVEQFRDKIFDPFFTTKADGQGSGLGLFTVRTIVRSHRGFIDVASQTGKGSIFTVYLPADTNEATQAPEVSQDKLPAGDGELVLLVDDEASVRDIVSATLEAYGYRVITASNGAEGLRLFQERESEIRLVLSDMNMPVMDGDAMIRAIRKINADITIIAASGLNNEPNSAKPATSDPRLSHLQKPFTARELLRAMKTAVGV